jgi:hypothetical protein
MSILTHVVRALDIPLGRAAEAYAKVGIAVADAFISRGARSTAPTSCAR